MRNSCVRVGTKYIAQSMSSFDTIKAPDLFSSEILYVMSRVQNEKGYYYVFTQSLPRYPLEKRIFNKYEEQLRDS